MTGIQDVVFRIPEEWDAVWFDSVIQDLFRYADVRNANGVGIAISGNSDTVATLSSTTLSEAYVVTKASSELTDERVLAGETSVIDITDGGPGNNVTVSVATNGLDFAKLQQISTGSFVGRTTAGTGNVQELTTAQATALLNAFVGDSGSGGTKGLVPAPSSGDAGKYLDGDGTFTTTNTAFNKNFGTSAGTVLEGDTPPSDIGAVPTSRILTAGVGLSGGGNLTADRTFDMANTAVSAGSYTSTNLTVDAQGRITAASSGSAGATTFDALTDTPSSKSGQAGKAPLVNAGETALEYVALSGIYQPLDATLTTIAATNPTTDQINYFTGANVASVTSLTSFARTLLDDTTQGAMQTTLNVDPAGTDNSTNVTLAGSLDYLTLSGQEITRNAIDLTTDVSGDLPVADGGTGSSTASGARTNLDVDQAGTDNSTNVTLAGTPNYITIVGQVITRALINLTSHVTGILPLANGGTGSSTLTSGEVAQIENIGSTTISGTQWGYVGALDQGLTTTSTVQHSKVLVNTASVIGTSILSVAGQVHFKNGTGSGITPTTDSDDVVIDSSGGGRLTMLAPAAKSSRITFANPTSAFDTWISCDSNTRNMQFRVAGGTRLTMTSTLASFPGALSKGSGSFKIAHPLPEMNKTHNLVHSFVESPKAENLYSGMATLVDGTISVNIDTHSGMTEGTFEVLNNLLTYSSSNESGFSPVKCLVVGNTITITCQDSASTDTVYWEVRGERKDQHMLETEWTDNQGRVIVEPEIKIE